MTRYRDIVTGVLSILIALGLYVLTFSVKDFAAVRIGPEFVPRIVSILLGILGIILLVQGIRPAADHSGTHAADESNTGAVSGGRKYEVLKSFLLLCFYIALLDAVGFIIMTVLYLFFQMVLLSPADNRRYAAFGVISIVTSVTAYYLFVGFFNVMIPSGILG